jgi:hypothetical protein
LIEREKEKLQSIEVANFVSEFSLPSTQRYVPSSNYTPIGNPSKPTLGDFMRNRGKAPISAINNSPSPIQNMQLPQTSQQQFPMVYQPQQMFSPIQPLPQNNYQYAPVSQPNTIPQNNYQYAPVSQQQTIPQPSHQIPSTSQPIHPTYQPSPTPIVSQTFMPNVQPYSVPFNGQQQFYSQPSMPISQPSTFVQPNPPNNTQPAPQQNGTSNGFAQQPPVSQSAQSILDDLFFGGQPVTTNTNVIQSTSNSAFVPTQQNISYTQASKPAGVSPWHTSTINPLLMNRKP